MCPCKGCSCGITDDKLTVPIGRDVVVDVSHFSLAGRRYRNLRQAVQRTHNCGVTTEVVDEQNLDRALLWELTEVLYAAHRAVRSERGFCMNLDGVLQGRRHQTGDRTRPMWSGGGVSPLTSGSPSI
jgi:Phosphatidylglycerol lysyltransferase, C-terminal